MSVLRRPLGLSLATVLASASAAVLPHLAQTEPPTAPTPPASAATQADAPTDTQTDAQVVLDQAREALAEPATSSYAAGDSALSRTLVDLGDALPDLSRPERREAEGLLARPTEDDATGLRFSAASQVRCTAHVCVHWTTSGKDAVDPTDKDGDGVPDWVETTQRALETAMKHFAAAGWRAPLSDAAASDHGPDGRVDVYLADVASLGFYGYCPADGLKPGARTTYGYCVLDNDYAYRQTSTEPMVALRAAAAHQLFTLVEYAYDAREDPWLMDGTATWMEDEVFDSANDNWNYLPTSTLARPGVPLDFAEENYSFGAWSWWRFLSEYFGTPRKARPDVVRKVWEAAADPDHPRDSLTATRYALSKLGTPFTKVFADYAALSHVARRWYFEGEQAPYPQAPMARWLSLSRAHPATGSMRSLRLDHLSSANVSLDRSATLRGKQLRIWVDGPARTYSPAAVATIHKRDGSLAWRTFRLDEQGDGVLTVPFARGEVSRVVLTLVNAGTRYECRQSTTLACGGLSKDDGRIFSYRARAIG
jgi:hypothetical protein